MPNPNNNQTAASATRSRIDVAHLLSRLKGQVITPDDTGYDAARIVFPGGIDRRPALIARVANDADVAEVIALARASGLELAVRSGGHSGAGHSVVEGGIVLDLSSMKAMQVDAQNRTAWAETGLTAAEYTRTAAGFGLATGFGDTGSVGIGGITLGGGVGYLVRKHGLTIDNLLAADLVTADGELVRLDAHSHPDLFWAIRGGGGNFGVVIRFQFRLHPVDQVVGGMLILPATPDVLAGFIDAALSAPDELSTIANVMPAPPMPFLSEEHHGKLIIMAMMAFVGAPDAAERALATFRSLATPLADMLKPIAYPEMYPPDPPDYHPLAVSTTMFMKSVDRPTAETILSYLEASDASLRVAQLRALGGALSRIPADATAFAHRQAPLMVNLAAFFHGPEDLPQRQAWVRDFAAALHQGDTGAYVNFLGDEGEARVRAAYPGQTWERLKQVKQRYDPQNLFHLNQNIPPE